jgi:hypothetical protein
LPRTLHASSILFSRLDNKKKQKYLMLERKTAIWSKESILACRNQTVGCEGRKCSFVRFLREKEKFCREL